MKMTHCRDQNPRGLESAAKLNKFLLQFLTFCDKGHGFDFKS